MTFTTPNAPANGGQILTDERMRYAFENCSRYKAKIGFKRGGSVFAEDVPPGDYVDSGMQDAWIFWQEAWRASLAAPAIPTVDRNSVAEEGAEILGSLIESIEKHGNYSAEATVTFLSQAKQCFDEIRATPATVKTAEGK